MDGIDILRVGQSIPHLAEYFGPWAIAETQGLSLARFARSLDLTLHMQTKGKETAEAESIARSDRGYPVADGTAVIELTGPLMKQVSSFTEGSSTVQARRQIRAAVADPDVSSILLLIDSPGGTAAGTQELADDVAWARSQKPTFAQINDLGASAAYWVASQAEKVFANKTALVGSIGTFLVVHDLSELAAKEGIKVHVVRAGEFKGMGTPGTEITDEQLTELQHVVDGINSHFLDAVAKGRGFDKGTVKELADGRIHLASEAKSKKLIDGVQGLDRTLSQLRNQKKPGGSRNASDSDGPSAEETYVTRGTSIMTEPNTAPAAAAPVAATLSDLKRVCPNASSDFLLAQLERGATIEMARDAWNGHLQTQLQARDAEIAKLKSKSDEECDSEDGDDEDDDDYDEDSKSKGKNKSKSKSKAKSAARPGVEPISRGNAAATIDNPQLELRELIDAKTKFGTPRDKAVKAVMHERPDLREALVEEANADRPVSRR